MKNFGLSVALLACFASCQEDTELITPVINVGSSETNYSYSNEEQVVSIPVSTTTNGYCEIDVEAVNEEDDISWLEDVILTDQVAPGIGLVFKLPAYSSELIDRQAILQFSMEGAEDVEITLTQGKLVPKISVFRDAEGSEDFIYSYKSSYSASVYVETNNQAPALVQSVEMDGVTPCEWLTVSEYNNTAYSGQTFSFILAENKDSELDRKAQLKFTMENAEPVFITITQEKWETPTEVTITGEGVTGSTLDGYNLNTAAEATTINLVVKTDSPKGWKSSFENWSQGEWFTLTTTEGLSEDLLSFTITENTTEYIRSGEIKLTSGNQEISILVNQNYPVVEATWVKVEGIENNGKVTEIAASDWMPKAFTITSDINVTDLRVAVLDSRGNDVNDTEVYATISSMDTKSLLELSAASNTGAAREWTVKIYSVDKEMFSFTYAQAGV